MDDVSIRLRCLELAVRDYSGDLVAETAKQYYEFVTGVKQAEGQYSFHLGDKG